MGYSDEFRSKVEQVFSADPVMKNLLSQFGMPDPGKNEDIFNDLVRSIVGQQLSVKAANTIYSRFLDLFKEMPTPDSLLEIHPDDLRAAGLSGQKTNYLRNVAAFFIQNDLENFDWEQLSDKQIIDLLIQIKGVGVWTAQMLLMFSFDRVDVFPLGDLGIKTGMMKLYRIDLEGKELERKLETIAEGWQPFRSIASKLIWSEKDQF